MTRKCVIEGCERTLYAFGLCRKHYDRRRQAGDASAPDRRPGFDETTPEFWSHVDRSSGPDSCWPWLHRRNRHGYGTLERGGRRTRRSLMAHRVAYLLAFGELPDEMYVLHRCDNPPCCNPRHLFLGTHADNMADMKAKDRARGGNRPGEQNNAAKLTADQVTEIRARSGHETQGALAREFGVHQSTISRICSGTRWGN